MAVIAEIGTAFVSVIPSARNFGSKLESDVGGGISGTGKRLGSVFGKAFLLGGSVLAAAGIGSFLKDSIGEAREAQKVGALTANVIKSTGGAAKISAAQVGDLATALSNKTGIDDEAIQSGSNLILTFKNIKREGTGLDDVFGRATAAAVDLSAAGFGDINGASKQLGKALNDPVKGITALSRSGVTFTADQQDLIKSLVAGGDALSAQKIILKEVESQVGGAAAASATAGEKAAVAFGNLKEQVGTALLPVIDKVAGVLTARVIPAISTFVTQLQSGEGTGGRVAAVFGQVATVFGTVFTFVNNNRAVFGILLASFVGLTAAVAAFNLVLAVNPITLVVVAVAALAAGLVYAYKNSETFRNIINTAFTFLRDTVLPIILNVASSVRTSLKPVFDQLVAIFQAKVLPALKQLVGAFQRNQPAIQRVVGAVIRFIGGLIKVQAAVLGKVLPVLIRFAGFIISKAVPAIMDYGTRLVEGGRKLIEFGRKVIDAAQSVAEFARKVGNKVTEVQKFFIQLPGKIVAALKSLPGQLLAIGGQIVDGLRNGIRNAAYKVEAAVSAIINKIPKKIRSLMDIGSPSKVTTILGGYIGDGLAVGLEKSSKKVSKATGKLLDKVKEEIQQRIDNFKSLAGSVGDNFAGNLFSGFETAGDFIGNLSKVKGDIGALIGAFTTLKGYGISGGFLAKLFADGGAPLILELAKSKDQATSAASLFGDIQSLSGSLGASVAQNTPDIGGGYTLADINATLVYTNQLLAKVPDGVAKGVNGAAKSGGTKGKKGKAKKK